MSAAATCYAAHQQQVEPVLLLHKKVMFSSVSISNKHTSSPSLHTMHATSPPACLLIYPLLCSCCNILAGLTLFSPSFSLALSLSLSLSYACQSTSEREGIINIRPDEDESPEKVLEGYSEAHEQELRDMAGRGPGLFDDLARSICPSVYGCEAVKKAVLLMLLGGVHKQTKEVRHSAWRALGSVLWKSTAYIACSLS
jgi:hypothetical protein